MVQDGLQAMSNGGIAQRSGRRGKGHGEFADPNAPMVIGYFDGIDGLRAVAIISVMIFHLNNRWLPGGFVGVDIFFVISGFVVTASVAHLEFGSFYSFVKYFYVRRIRRIYPALTLCLFFTAGLYILFVPRAWLSDSIERVGLSAFFGASNFVLGFNDDSYFSPRAAFDPFTHTWSLAVEEQFYLLFPFLMYAYQRWGNLPLWRFRLIAIVSVLCIFSFLVSAALAKYNWQYSFYLMPGRFWELGVGMLLCLTYESWSPALSKSFGRLVTVFVASSLAIAISFATPNENNFPYPMALFPVLGSAALIASTVAADRLGRKTWLSAPGPVFVGRLSYSLYLWHWPIFVLMRWTCGLETMGMYAVAVMATVALAVISYFFVEGPARMLGNKVARGPLIIGSATAICLVAACTQVGLEHKDRFSLSTTRNTAIWYPEGMHVRSNTPSCTLGLAHSNSPGIGLAIFTPTGCPRNPDGGRLFVVGDSHAYAYSRDLQMYSLSRGRQVLSYGIPGCSFLKIFQPSEARCSANERRVGEAVAMQLGPHDLVFLPSLRVIRFKDQRVSVGQTSPAEASLRTMSAGVNEASPMLRLFASKGARIVLEAPTPIFKAPPFRCSDWFNSANPDCRAGFSVSRQEMESRRHLAIVGITELQHRVPNISVWDPLPLLCSQQNCNAFYNGKPLFFDGDHLSGYGNDVLYTKLAASFDNAWPR